MAKRLSEGQKMPTLAPKRSLDSLLRSRSLRLIQVFLYLSVLFLWFKDNFYQFRDMSFPLLVPLIPLSLILVAQVVLFVRRRGYRVCMTIPNIGNICGSIDRGASEIQVEIPVPGSYDQFDYEEIPSAITKRKKSILYLSGISSPVELRGELSRLLSPSAKILILSDNNFTKDIRLHLFSQFDFRSPFWYGNYNQSLGIYLNEKFVGTFSIREGDNIISITLADLPLNEKKNILNLRFKYFLPMKMRPVGPWDASAFLVAASLH